MPDAQVDFVRENETIIINGAPEDVQPVEQALSNQIAQMIRDMSIELVKVPNQHHRHIVGKKVDSYSSP